MTHYRLAIVVLAWNHCDYTLECLDSLLQQHIPHMLYVVDNNSSDNTVEAVRERYPAAHVIVNNQNDGFAGGNNIGLHKAFSDGANAVLVLNNDARLAPDALTPLVDSLHRYPHAGLLNPLILFAQEPHRVWYAGATLYALAGWSFHKEYNAPRETIPTYVRSTRRATGCALIITRDCYERIGVFDESLFMYCEDLEYSLRAIKAGFSVLLVPESVVYHHVSVSTGEKAPDPVYYSTRNMIVTMDRHLPLPMGLQTLRRLLIVAGQMYYVAKRPRAFGRIRDIWGGYWDARRHELGSRHP